jgi:hypothetical protein
LNGLSKNIAIYGRPAFLDATFSFASVRSQYAPGHLIVEVAPAARSGGSFRPIVNTPES